MDVSVHPVHAVNEVASVVDLRDPQHHPPVLEGYDTVLGANGLELRLPVPVQRAVDLEALPDAADAYAAARQAQPPRRGWPAGEPRPERCDVHSGVEPDLEQHRVPIHAAQCSCTHHAERVAKLAAHAPVDPGLALVLLLWIPTAAHGRVPDEVLRRPGMFWLRTSSAPDAESRFLRTRTRRVKSSVRSMRCRSTA